jgi:hypothetical protein
MLPAAHGAALLQVAMNCSNSETAAAAASRMPATAAAAARRMPGLLEATTAQRLLLTAVTRQHTSAVRHMVGLAVMLQHVDAQLLEAMIRQSFGAMPCLSTLMDLLAADQLSSDAVARLLRAAAQEHMSEAVGELCYLTAAWQLSSEQVEAVLQAHMQGAENRGNTWFFSKLYHLPGAKQLSRHTVVQLLHMAIITRSWEHTFLLCQLPAFAALSSEDVTGLLQAAFAQHSSRSVEHIIENLVQLPAFRQLNSAVVAQLLHAAACHYCSSTSHTSWHLSFGLKSLCSLPAARDVSIEQLLQPLMKAVQHSEVCTYALCALPAAQQLSSGALDQLLLAASAGEDRRSAQVLLRLPAAQQLGSAAFAQLLQAAVDAASIQEILSAVSLPAAA